MSSLPNFPNRYVRPCGTTTSDQRYSNRYRPLSSRRNHLSARHDKRIERFVGEQEGGLRDEDDAEEGGERDEEGREGVGFGEDEVGEESAEDRGTE